MNLWQDVRFGARLLAKDYWFTLAATTVLALGLGASAAVFTFVNAALMRGLPFRYTRVSRSTCDLRTADAAPLYKFLALC